MPDVPVIPSATGTAILPQLVVKFGALFFGVVGTVAGLPEALTAAGVTLQLPPWLLLVVGLSKVLLGLGVALGIASQGARVVNAQSAGAAAAKSSGATINA